MSTRQTRLDAIPIDAYFAFAALHKATMFRKYYIRTHGTYDAPRGTMNRACIVEHARLCTEARATLRKHWRALNASGLKMSVIYTHAVVCWT